MEQKSRAKLWIMGVVSALVILFLGTALIFFLSHFHLKLSVKPPRKSAQKIVVFDTKDQSESDVPESVVPHGQIPDVAGRYDLHYNRHMRYLGVFKVPDLDEILEIQRDGERISGTLKVKKHDPKTGAELDEWYTQPITGSVIPPNRIQFKTPPASKPPLRWEVFVGTVEEQKDGSSRIVGKVQLHQPEPNEIDVNGKARVNESVIGDWNAKKVSGDNP